MTRTLYIFLLLILPFITSAQTPLPAAVDTCPVNEMQPVILKTSILAPIQKHHMFTLGIELPVYKTITAQLEGGYIYDYEDITYSLDQSKGSYDLRFDAKYYIPQSTTLRAYTGTMITYRQVNANRGKVVFQNYTDEHGNVLTKAFVDMQDAALIREQQTSFLWQAGIQPLVLEHLAVNVFLGLGAAFTKEENRAAPDANPEIIRNWRSTSLVGMHIGYAF